jgi:hypothetical protein
LSSIRTLGVRSRKGSLTPSKIIQMQGSSSMTPVVLGCGGCLAKVLGRLLRQLVLLLVLRLDLLSLVLEPLLVPVSVLLLVGQSATVEMPGLACTVASSDENGPRWEQPLLNDDRGVQKPKLLIVFWPGPVPRPAAINLLSQL